MISHIYNLDLNTINSTITEINNEFTKRKNSTSDVLQKSETFSHIKIGSPCTEIVVDDIDLNEEEIWGFNLVLFNGNNTPSYSMYFNNDKLLSNYNKVLYYSIHGGAPTAASSDDAIIFAVNADQSSYMSGNIIVKPDKKQVVMITNVYRWEDEFSGQIFLKYSMKPQHEKIFQITINSSVENAITKDSYFKLWRVS